MRIFENEYDRIKINAEDIPEWAKWLAVDREGTIYAYEDEPVLGKGELSGRWILPCVDKRLCFITEIEGIIQIRKWQAAKWKI